MQSHHNRAYIEAKSAQVATKDLSNKQSNRGAVWVPLIIQMTQTQSLRLYIASCQARWVKRIKMWMARL